MRLHPKAKSQHPNQKRKGTTHTQMPILLRNNNLTFLIKRNVKLTRKVKLGGHTYAACIVWQWVS